MKKYTIALRGLVEVFAGRKDLQNLSAIGYMALHKNFNNICEKDGGYFGVMMRGMIVHFGKNDVSIDDIVSASKIPKEEQMKYLENFMINNAGSIPSDVLTSKEKEMILKNREIKVNTDDELGDSAEQIASRVDKKLEEFSPEIRTSRKIMEK